MNIFSITVAAVAFAFVLSGWARERDRHAATRERLAAVEQHKNLAYRQRNIAVVALAKMAIIAGYRAGHGYDSDPAKDWDPEWRHVVYVELPDGKQVSWHMDPSTVRSALTLPEYPAKWDGTWHSRTLGWADFPIYADLSEFE